MIDSYELFRSFALMTNEAVANSRNHEFMHFKIIVGLQHCGIHKLLQVGKV